VHQEQTAESEIVTPILTDEVWNWSNFYDMYDMLYDTGATISDNTASHLHIGTHKINTPEKLSLLLKTLVVFEPIIFKFGYGYSDEPRHFLRHKSDMSVFSPMMSPKRVSTFTDVLDKYNYNSPGVMLASFKDFLAQELRFRPVFTFNDFDFNKLQYNIACDTPSAHDHMEIRCFNGTLDPEIAQNNINLITKIIVAVIEDKIDKDYDSKKYKCLTKCLEIKFLQCFEFRKAVLDSGSKNLVEYAPWDSEFGAKWDSWEEAYTGINACGRCMMMIRENAINGMYSI
jgi:predicted NAD-dependent protein-ADP-ribosyltransferase YbiA (DUF1768 family)